MISKIVLKDVASYKKEAVLETDKKVNLLYGLNGTGKSTLSGFLYEPNDTRFSECKVEGLDENDTVLVYTQKFVQDTFYETQDIHGIFTLSRGNAEAKKKIDEANAEIGKLTDQKNKLIEKAKKEEVKYYKQKEEYKNQVWKIKTEYTGGDRVLEFCLDGLKSNKDLLIKHLISLKKPEGEIDYSVEDLKIEAQQIQGEVQSRRLIPMISNAVEDVEKSELLNKVIVGNKNSTVAALIEKLDNSAWVNEGIDFIHMDGEIGTCPFCQKQTITRGFLDQINAYFDESYNRDRDLLERMTIVYEHEIEYLVDTLLTINEDDFLTKRKDEMAALISNLREIAQKNIVLLKEKENAPSIQISLQSISGLVDSINGLIEVANEEVTLYNERIADIKGAKSKIKDRFWTLMRERYDSVIELLLTSDKAYEKNVKAVQKELKDLTDEISKQNGIIDENRKKTINIDEAVNNIKAGLIDIGITDFTIEKYSEEDALYRLKRGNSDEDIFKTLSEGEKMVISFLYFVEMCKGELMAGKPSGNKIIVIDDPISSLSHIYVFNIGRLIHNEFLRTDKYDQIFVMTHSLYFFYELTNTDHKKREETQRLFRICKNTESSYFENMKYEEIQNDYQAYWYIVRDEKQAPALIANCMRNIIEYFFNFVEKNDLSVVFQKKEMQETRYMAFNRYINRESHSKGQNIFDIKEFDYDSFKEAFKQVFELTGYIDHYRKMMKA